jgi:hypothetical protein
MHTQEPTLSGASYRRKVRAVAYDSAVHSGPVDDGHALSGETPPADQASLLAGQSQLQNGTAEVPTAEPILRFSIEELREAGASLGRIESTLTPPRTTFEALNEEAQELRRRIVARERGVA